MKKVGVKILNTRKGTYNYHLDQHLKEKNDF